MNKTGSRAKKKAIVKDKLAIFPSKNKVLLRQKNLLEY